MPPNKKKRGNYEMARALKEISKIGVGSADHMETESEIIKKKEKKWMEFQ